MAPRNMKVEDSGGSSTESSGSESHHHGHRSIPKDSQEYRLRREKNNLAVRRSRDKSKQKAQQTLEKVTQLRKENKMLESKIECLSKELCLLKDIFLSHAGSAHGLRLDHLAASSTTPMDAISNDHQYLAPSDTSHYQPPH